MIHETQDTFLYFAYGSNLLKTRIHINNPSAEFLGAGKLEDHQLDFKSFAPRWGGCVATIVPTSGAHVWGAIWKLNLTDMPSLDKQEGVETKWYFPKTVDVLLPEGNTVQCRTYQLCENPLPRRIGETIPEERRPSKTYLEVIITGAIECELPEDYIQKLKIIPHNGKEASDEVFRQLRK